MPSQLWVALLLCLLPSPWVITSGLPSIPNPNGKAAFNQILQANMEIERDFFSSPPLPDNVFEGDIELTQEQLMNIDIYGDIRGNVSRAAGSNSRIRWPNAIIPYEIDCSLQNMPEALNAIEAATKEWESKTCIRFVKRTSQRDYLWFFRQKGCWCNVGRIGGKTSLSVGFGCEYKHVMVHEIGHAVGFWHEQSRPDRDSYVQVLKQNILPGFDSAFAKYGRDQIDSLGLPYDYGSIMHYPFNAFSKNGQPTLRALNPLNGKTPYKALSVLDAEQTNKMYGCATKKRKRRQTVCADYNHYCRSWAQNQQCRTNPAYMNVYCKKSCGLCGTQACVDRDYRCYAWVRYGYCRTNMYTRRNCQKSCGLCPRPPTVKPKPPTVRPKPPTVKPKPPTAGPKPPTVRPKPPTSKPVVPNQNCGVRHYGSSGRVVNGKTADKNSWPWQARMTLHGAHKCGGSLVAPRWVLTAAHCVRGSSYNPGYRVTLGEHNIRRREGSEQHFSVKRIIVHPYYQRATTNNDMALLELDRPASLNKAVALVCLPKQGQSVSTGQYCTITGWGRTGYNRPGASVLQEASLPVAQQDKCRAYMRYWGTVTSKMICGGFGGSSTVSGCFGDSGGPFVCQQGGGKYVIHGVVSWGTRTCSAGRNEYTVFARVSEFESWIRKYIGLQPVTPPRTPAPPKTPPPPQTPPPPKTPPPPQTPPPPKTPPPPQTPSPPNTPPPPQTPPPPNTPPPTQTPSPPNTPPPPQTPSPSNTPPPPQTPSPSNTPPPPPQTLPPSNTPPRPPASSTTISVTVKPPVTIKPRPPIIKPEKPTGMKCEDRHPNCPEFAAAGQCSASPGWMEKNCKKSCGSKRCDKQPVRPVAPCSTPLGVGWDFKLPDSAFSASSTLDVGGGWDSGARNARMYFTDELKAKRVGAWCAATPKNQWLQVDLGNEKYITAVGTQGRHKYYEHVKSYKLAFSLDGITWSFVKIGGEDKIFDGNCDHFTPVVNILEHGITARYIRFYPVSYNYVCMRVEVYGCDS